MIFIPKGIYIYIYSKFQIWLAIRNVLGVKMQILQKGNFERNGTCSINIVSQIVRSKAANALTNNGN